MWNMVRRSPPPLPPSQKADLLRGLLLIISLLILNPLTDASKIYHTIRGQDTIKLYVIFNALEVSFGVCLNKPTVLTKADCRQVVRIHWSRHPRLLILSVDVGATDSSQSRQYPNFPTSLLLRSCSCL
jgi:hypothetical protein